MILMEIERLKPYPSAYILIPEMSPVEYVALKEDIKIKGILTPIEIIPDKKNENNFLILDGIHRYKIACELKLKKIPVIVINLKNLSPEEYIFSKSIFRRNLKEDQIICIAVEWFIKEQKKIDDICNKFKISKNKFKKILKIKKDNPELFDFIKTGNVSLNSAWQIIENIKNENNYYPIIDEFKFFPDNIKNYLKKLPISVQQNLFYKLNDKFNQNFNQISNFIQNLTENNVNIINKENEKIKYKEELKKTKESFQILKKEKNKLEKEVNKYKFISMELLKNNENRFVKSPSLINYNIDILNQITNLKKIISDNLPNLKNLPVRINNFSEEEIKILSNLKIYLILFLNVLEDKKLNDLNTILNKLQSLDKESSDIILNLLNKIFSFLDILFENLNKIIHSNPQSFNSDNFQKFLILTKN